jgi:GNAT superfamily N-acetyltransferase
MMQGTVTIRLATPADLAGVETLLARSYRRLLAADYPPSVLVLALPLITRAQPSLLASGSYFVAGAAEGRIFAAGGWTPLGPGRGSIRHVATDPDHLRKGIGAALLRAALAQAAKAGVVRMTCQSTRTAVPFYTALGFVPGREVTVPLGPGIGFPAVMMARDLP